MNNTLRRAKTSLKRKNVSASLDPTTRLAEVMVERVGEFREGWLKLQNNNVKN